MTKKEKVIKSMLITIGILFILWLLVICLKDFESLRNPFYFLFDLYYQTLMHPWLLLGIISLFIGIAMPFKKNKKIWKALLIIGIIIFAIPFIVGVVDAISGYTGMCMFDCTPVYGLEAFKEAFILYSIIYIPGYIIGVILIILSAIKLKKKKK